MIDYYSCPKCNRLLKRSGAVPFEDRMIPVFQCDECLVTVEMFGTKREIALTFAVGADGEPFDPASPDGSLPL